MKMRIWMGLVGACALTMSVAAACGGDDEGSGGGTSTGSATGTGTGTGTGSGTTSGTETGTETGTPSGTSTGSTDPMQDCATYCSIIQANCTGDNQQYISEATCMGICAGFAMGNNGTGADATGENTLGCRIYHGNLPAEMDPATHCTHAGPGGDGQCGDNCESFCQLNDAVCGFGSSGTNQWTMEADCLTACGTMDTGTAYSTAATTATDNSFACHMYHLTAAADTSDANAADTHCVHTNPGVAGPPCGS